MFLIEMCGVFGKASPRVLKASSWTSFTMAAALGATLLAGTTGTCTQAAPHELPMQAVINSHTVQPRNNQLQVLGIPDTTSAEDAEIDELYRELMQEHHADMQHLN
jgi:hypothetical protein